MSDFDDKLNSILSSPEDMKKIMDLARSMSAPSEPKDVPGGDVKAAASALGDIDPKLFRVMSRLMGEYSSSKSDKAALLGSVKPYLKEDRREKLDRAVQIAKIAKIAKTAFSEFSGGDFNL